MAIDDSFIIFYILLNILFLFKDQTTLLETIKYNITKIENLVYNINKHIKYSITFFSYSFGTFKV